MTTSLRDYLSPSDYASAKAEKLLRSTRKKTTSINAKTTWRDWLTSKFPAYVRSGFAPRHEEFWEWVWKIESDTRPDPYVTLWPRGGAKSTSAELASVAVAERKVRKYILYTSATQDQADKHVATIAALFEAIGVDRAINKYGSSKGWRRERLRTNSGVTIDSLGLDTASRGIKTEEQRPDMIILDDVDDRHDSAEIVQKKIETLTETVLPTGSNDCATLFVQNLVHPKSIASQLAGKDAKFLFDRIVSGPFPALDNFSYTVEGNRYKILTGIPTWEGQDVIACENYINTWGIISFERECQHKMDDAENALWKREWFNRNRVTEAPKELTTVIAIDPSASSKDGSDEAGIIAIGSKGGRGYVIGDYSKRCSPYEWATIALCAFVIHNAAYLVGEGNNGGEMVETVIRSVSLEDVIAGLIARGYTQEWADAHAIGGKSAPYMMVWASDGKQTRAQPVSAYYQRGLIHHIGTFSELETECCNWIPGKSKSPNRLDGLVWGATKLGLVDGGSYVFDSDKAEQANEDKAFAELLEGDDEE